MLDYKTVEEKAAEWSLSPRHVQYLCRNGKINGVAKHAEVWFIPADAPSPAKKTKSDKKDFKFVGTKKVIFFTSIELFMLNGFDSVSLKDVADKIGIRQSTIYNHFKSKNEILETIYDFFVYHYKLDRPSMEDMAVNLQTESVMGIINAIRYTFKEEYLQSMSDIVKILFQRMGLDSRAREIAKGLIVDEGIKYVEDVLNMGVETGRFAPFDTHITSVFINSLRIFTMYYWIIDPSSEGLVKVLEDEQVLYGYIAKFVKDLRL